MPVSGALPRTWRPRLGTAVAYGMAVLVLVLPTLLWLRLPAESRQAWSVAQLVTVAACYLAVAAVLHLLARPRVRADRGGLTVVNMVRSRRLDWAEVIAVRLGPGDPWVMLDLSDGTTMPAMAIQSADGARARRAVAELDALVTQMTGIGPER